MNFTTEFKMQMESEQNVSASRRWPLNPEGEFLEFTRIGKEETSEILYSKLN